MTGMQPCQVVAVMKSVWRIDFVGPGRTDNGQPASDRNRTDSRSGLATGDAQLLIAIPDAGPIECIIGNEDRAIESDAGFINYSRADRARPVERDILWPAELCAANWNDGKRPPGGLLVEV